MSDPISNMFTAIKNAQVVLKESITVPHSKFKMEILKLLQKEGYIKEAVKRGKKAKKVIEIKMLYKDGTPAIKNIRRISKPSRRVYGNMKNLHSFGSGRGAVILSTPAGILLDRDARKEKAGGEIIAEIY
jgi:small subunit ribosomal protein S8